MCLSLFASRGVRILGWMLFDWEDDTSALMGRLSLNPARQSRPIGARLRLVLDRALLGKAGARSDPARMTNSEIR